MNKENIKCLEYLCHCDAKTRKYILNNAKKDLIYAFCECLLNVLNGNVKLDEKSLKK